MLIKSLFGGSSFARSKVSAKLNTFTVYIYVLS